MIFLFILGAVSALNCGIGTPILTRRPRTTNTLTNSTVYILQNMCVCPADYYSQQCLLQAKVYCYLTPSTQSYIPYEETLNFTLQADCYVKRKTFTRKIYQQMNYRVQNHNIGNMFQLVKMYPKIQIIWANDTQLFDQTGNYKDINWNQINKSKQQNSTNNSIYQIFTYKSKMFNLDFSNSEFEFESSIVKYRNGQTKPIIINVQPQISSFIQNEQKIYINESAIINENNIPNNGYIEDIINYQKSFATATQRISFNMQLNKSQAESQTIIVELKINELQSNFSRELSINKAVFKVQVSNFGLPLYVQGNYSLSGGLKIIIFVASLVFAFILFQYFPVLCKWCKLKFKRKRQNMLVQQ